MQARLLALALVSVVTVVLSSGVAISQKRPSLLLLPLVPAADIDVEETEGVDGQFLRVVRNHEAYTIESLADYEKRYGAKPARRLLQCADDTDCLHRNLKRAHYDLVVVGKVEPEGEDRRSVRFQVYNLDEHEVRLTKGLAFTKDRLGSKRLGRWAETLLGDPSRLVDLDEEPADEPVVTRPARRERPAAAPAPVRSSGPSLPSADEIEGGLRQALEAYLAGSADRAAELTQRVVSNPCRCDADRQAYTVKAMLDEFRTALSAAEEALQRRGGAQAVTEFQKIGGLDAAVSDEARKLGVETESSYVGKINTRIADAYVMLASQQMSNWAYVAAKESLEKALEYAPGHPEATDELGKMLDVYVPRLMRRANVAAYSEPESAADYLRQVMELVGPGDPNYVAAQKRLEELED